MQIDEAWIRDRCTDAVFERGQHYRTDGRIRRIDRFGDVVTAIVQGSSQYDVTVELDESNIESRCTCPYDGPGDCKHVVAVLLEIAADPPADDSERVTAVLDDVSPADLRAFVRAVLAERPALRDRFLARYGDAAVSFEELRDEIEALFDQYTQDHPAVTDAIDFWRFFEMAERYRERDRHFAAAAVYRAIFTAIDENEGRIDGAYDHHARALQSALDGYVDCVIAADLDQERFETYAGVLAELSSAGSPVNDERFRRALEELEERR
ncbi:zinc finger SWIM domain protein [Halorhabdus utahensis DSM 12940]|uniref:Zinc finger SWIM domain protein n=1 Tax=Halorhabdus utahensis (strain DSM 12940 / JCM 11049 / AX-2) TaxID=519442 RepID=C7NM99_HALUD|nr:SWIM zinc finger family protein [Halorhabdus utahensis]ACV11307.1 zinc finger SWIM domain protein [Halorhabdus utahensis DSM 12940]